jgi:glutaryl-CoA transferase
MPHASGQTVKVIANPVRLSGTPPEYRLPPPTLGQHTEEVLREALGISEPDLADLRSKGVI